MNLRAARRAVTLAFAFTVSIFNLAITRLRGPFTPQRRALWLQSTAKLVISSLGIKVRVTGRPPLSGILVSNHLSYLDIAIYAAISPSSMVAKAAIRNWPFFGMMARSSGALFVDRSSRKSAVEVTNQVAQRLREPIPVLFFPEGTSTNGEKVLRFHSRLFTPAVEAGIPITAASVRYVVEDGTPERELCWFGNDILLPHMWKVLGAAGFTAEVQFGEPHIYPDRRTAADRTHAEVEAMRAGELVLQ
jgi:1-acyl-sn-glycerol-3-phosphate acyltransferase